MNLHTRKLLLKHTIIFFAFIIAFPGFGQKLKIMALGNSITFDTYDSDPRPPGQQISYRYRLYTLLTGAGYTFDFVGNEKNGGDSLPVNAVDSLNYTDHAGFPGATPDNLIYILNTSRDYQAPHNCLISHCNAKYLSEFKPDVILLHIGTNGLTDNADAEQHANSVDSILNLVDEYELSSGKTVPVFLAQIINRKDASGNPTHGPTIYYNDLLQSLVSSRPSDKIILVDMENSAGIDYWDDMRDEYHTNESGYIKMGNKWFAAMEGYNIKAPVVYDIPDDTIYEGQPNITINLNNYVFDPQEADDDITWSYLPSYSPNFDISIVNGVATISLDNPNWSGNETFTFKAEDSGNGSTPLYDTDEVTIYSMSVNDIPVIQNRGPFHVNEDSQIPVTLDSLEVVDPDNIYPDDFTLHIQAGSNYTIISNYIIKPNANYHGNLTVPMYVNDGLDNSPVKNMTVVVSSINDYPWINIPSVRTVNEDSQYNRTITAGDVDVEDVLTLSKLQPFPGWLTFNPSTGQLSGTPDNEDVGIYTVKIRVYDGHVNVDSTFNITVINTNDLPVFTSYPEETSIETYDEFEYYITATDIDPTNDWLTYEVTQKPGWLSYEPVSRLLSGIPTKNDTGIFPVQIRVFDGTGYTYQNFDITVELMNHPPEITSTPDNIAYEDSLYIYALKATDKEKDPLTYSAITKPGWSSFYPSGVLMGIPDAGDIGSYDVVLSVSDGENIVYDSFNIEVVGVNDKPVILGTARPLYTLPETPLEISLDDLEVEDNDNIYPDDFTLKLQNGNNYTVIDYYIIPHTGFTGYLKVGVIVNDGMTDSDLAEISVGVGTTSVFDRPGEASIVKLVYPNPAKDYVYFRFQNNYEQSVISFYDGSMKLIKKVIVPGETAELRIDIDEFICGIVFYKIDYENIYYSGKLIIK